MLRHVSSEAEVDSIDTHDLEQEQQQITCNCEKPLDVVLFVGQKQHQIHSGFDFRVLGKCSAESTAKHTDLYQPF